MTAPTFTPGPWVAHKMENIFHIHRHGVRPGYAERIADVIYWSPGHTGPKGNPLIDEARANAHLIAAAPDMFAALERARKRLYNSMILLGSSPEFADEGCSEVDAALAKARGERQ